MRVFIYEYLSSGALTAPGTAPSLQMEGWAMLSAVLEDFGLCPDVETVTLLDRRLLPKVAEQIPHIVAHVTAAGEEEQIFRELAADADGSLIIAPEFDGILAQRCRWVEEEGGHLLGPSSAAILLTANKVTLTRQWIARAIATPPLLESPSWSSANSYPYPVVLKPRYGAGSQATFLVHDEEELARSLLQAGAEGWAGEFMLQPYVPGLAASVAFLAGRDDWRSLPAVEQHLSDDGRFHYLGGRLPLPEALDRRARRLAERAARGVEGLHGWFGVDLVLGDADDGSADVVLEINPRLTTSYVGLRRLARFNLAEALLALVTGSRPPSWDWRTGTIVFRADQGSRV
jgi:predicted ATP-grasp superfamily ATP-dependent carboligase